MSSLRNYQNFRSDTCPRLIEAIPTRMYDEKRPGDVLKVPGDPLDDVADDARYGIYTFITSTEKPPEVTIHDQVRQLAEQGDLPSTPGTLVYSSATRKSSIGEKSPL
jgi:hypothetical protein